MVRDARPAGVRDTFAPMRNVGGLSIVCLGAVGLSFAALVLAACAGANYPDRPDVTKAQARWCEALAKAAGSDRSWGGMCD